MLTLPALTVWLVLPLLFTFAIEAARGRMSGAPLSDRSEKALLLLYLLPIPLGAALWHLAPALPEFGGLALPVEPRLDDPGSADHEHGAGSPYPSWPQLITVGVLSVVALGACLGLARFVLRIAHLTKIERTAVPVQGVADAYEAPSLSVPLLGPSGRILLPAGFSQMFASEELSMVLQHERAHRRRGDHRLYLLLGLLDALCWCHPAVRLQTIRCRLAAEMACDREACGSRNGERRRYAALVLKILNAAGSARPCAPAVFSPRTQGEFHMRLTHIMRPQRPRRKGGLIAIAATLTAVSTAGQFALAEGSSASFSVAPVAEGRVTSTYGIRADPWTKEQTRHHGLDIAAPLGTPVRAPAAGQVTRAREMGAYGNVLEVTHEGGIVTRYAQLDGFEANVGDRVRAGQTIARLGSSGRSTGPHLHLEVFVDGERVDPATVVKLPGR
ncbi:M23/M56 family metallopeptidase [Parvularcula maris]|uniref:M23/M56 family metallopeptidase n=1 Tax=Parvularcula maris TaxID=2965077 RepID=A0A9X2L8Q0_9PROT|nr:M23/M56 family metallopeptidase [Parvularcula maris]MCQ8184267.1 M23/M56 family metallopeptidase [Parvularcula maris]